MSKRFMWGSEQVEEFFNLLRNSYRDYLMAKELRRMDEFYEMLGSCMGTDGLVVQNFLKKIGRSYRDILLQAETCEEGGQLPERKLRGSARIYALYEEYYQMYYLGAVPSRPNDLEASGSFQQKSITSHNDRKRKHLPEAAACKRRSRSPVSEIDTKEENIVHVDDEDAANRLDGDTVPDLHLQRAGELVDHFSTEEVPTETASKKVVVENGEMSPRHSLASDAARGTTKQRQEDPKSDGVFGTTTTDFQERFLKLMENQNHILASIVDELNMIKHAVLDANGLQTITYVK
ncbi:uncharacterized protein LOC119724917 [Patiria miniata]|uniref:Uncharacterized protein n=1 Tax=Patiria miniata TaxID=46514 RepID=A0A913ZK46_PATMI|nr:uncharacterized protein LOC119724917 [Patiria miniata]